MLFEKEYKVDETASKEEMQKWLSCKKPSKAIAG